MHYKKKNAAIARPGRSLPAQEGVKTGEEEDAAESRTHALYG
jgi:hypothetical protein